MSAERMTPERLAEISGLLDRRKYAMGLAARDAIEMLLAELDAVTRERDAARDGDWKCDHCGSTGAYIGDCDCYDG